MYRVVIVEDDPMVSLLNRTFVERDARFQVVQSFQDGRAALAWLEQNPADLAVLDVYMPLFTGLELLHALRGQGVGIDAIMVTAANDAPTVDTLLKLGVVDYLVKPFALEELHARIRALLRRHNNQGESELIVGNLTLNMGRRQVWMGGEELILTPKEYALLSRLMLKAGSPVHREILYNDIYNWDNEPSTNTLEVHIHNLRDKVGKARIRTVRGFGYMLVANEEN